MVKMDIDVNKYDNFCIYKIHHKDDDKTLYIGSTTNYKRRVFQHKKNSTNFRKKTALYKYIRALGGFDNFIMSKVMDYPCKTRGEGLIKERELIELMKANLNTIMMPKTKTI
jgi:predicted GIY-YIG superfamily endonuclease